MIEVYFLYMVHAVAVGISVPGVSNASTVAQEQVYVNHFKTLEQCQAIGEQQLKDPQWAHKKYFEFHCIPGFTTNFSGGRLPTAEEKRQEACDLYQFMRGRNNSLRDHELPFSTKDVLAAAEVCYNGE